MCSILDPLDKKDPVPVFSLDSSNRQRWYDDLMAISK
jgi:hypothetical protein